jgi:hypothetical protein
MGFHALDDLLTIHPGILQKQAVRLKNHAWSTESALNGAMVNECPLDRMEFSVLRQSLDGDHLFTRDILNAVMTGSNGFFVDDNGARPALLAPAAVFDPGQLQIGSKDPEKLSLSFRGDAYRTVIQLEMDGLVHRLPLSVSENPTIGTGFRLSQSRAFSNQSFQL